MRDPRAITTLMLPVNRNIRLPRPGPAATPVSTARALFLSRSSQVQLLLEWVEVQHL